MSGERVQARPGWVLFGGCLLAFLSAAVNAEFMLRLGVSVSHLTGDVARVTAKAVAADGGWSPEVTVLCLSILGFVGGAATSGFFIHHSGLQLSRPYGRSVICVGLLLLATLPVSERSVPAACFLAAWACGMQNALATRYRGLVLRTTHITGLLTDFGQILGMRLRGHPIETWKITTPLILAGAFAGGAATGALLHLRTGVPVMFACGSAYVGGGLLWAVLKRWFQSGTTDDG